MCPFVVEDLFAVGLGFDIAGAYLLARGLLATSADIAARSAMALQFSPDIAVGQARDKVDGALGLVALVSGFVLQAIAYALTLGGRGGGTGDAQHGIAAIGLCTLTVGLVLLVWRVAHRRLLLRAVVSIARVNYLTRPPVIHDKPYEETLALLGQQLGHRFREGESSAAYFHRVFGVEAEPGTPPGD